MEIGGADTDKCSHRTGYITGRHQLYVEKKPRPSGWGYFCGYVVFGEGEKDVYLVKIIKNIEYYLVFSSFIRNFAPRFALARGINRVY